MPQIVGQRYIWPFWMYKKRLIPSPVMAFFIKSTTSAVEATYGGYSRSGMPLPPVKYCGKATCPIHTVSSKELVKQGATLSPLVYSIIIYENMPILGAIARILLKAAICVFAPGSP